MSEDQIEVIDSLLTWLEVSYIISTIILFVCVIYLWNTLHRKIDKVDESHTLKNDCLIKKCRDFSTFKDSFDMMLIRLHKLETFAVEMKSVVNDMVQDSSGQPVADKMQMDRKTNFWEYKGGFSNFQVYSIMMSRHHDLYNIYSYEQLAEIHTHIKSRKQVSLSGSTYEANFSLTDGKFKELLSEVFKNNFDSELFRKQYRQCYKIAYRGTKRKFPERFN